MTKACNWPGPRMRRERSIPCWNITVPDKVTAIIVGVVDAQGRGGPRGVYRLTVDPQSPVESKDEFKLTTLTQRLSLPAGGRVVLPVLVERRGYDGKIELGTALPLPGVRLEGATIPEGADGALVTVERDEARRRSGHHALARRGGDGGEAHRIV